MWDHPRACGEQHHPQASAQTSAGSSPRVRGAGDCRVRCGVDGGIIPARAGSRFKPNNGRYLNEGSSPRVRGAVDCGKDGANDSGIIPARAGSRLHEHMTV